MRQRLPEQLDSWLERSKDSAIKVFQSFAKGLKEDYDAVKNGLTLDVSNGPVEGQNNRLKMLKRQMFGRAGLWCSLSFCMTRNPLMAPVLNRYGQKVFPLVLIWLGFSILQKSGSFGLLSRFGS